MTRYLVKKMNKPKPRHNVSGEYGVWDRDNNRWVLNAEFVDERKARKIAYAMNK